MENEVDQVEDGEMLEPQVSMFSDKQFADGASILKDIFITGKEREVGLQEKRMEHLSAADNRRIKLAWYVAIAVSVIIAGIIFLKDETELGAGLLSHLVIGAVGFVGGMGWSRIRN